MVMVELCCGNVVVSSMNGTVTSERFPLKILGVNSVMYILCSH